MLKAVLSPVQEAEDTCPPLSILVILGDLLDMKTGASVRTRAIFDALCNLGPVHVISIVSRASNQTRLRDIPAAASHSIVVQEKVRGLARTNTAKMMRSWLMTKRTQKETKRTDAARIIDDIATAHGGPVFVALRYEPMLRAAAPQTCLTRNRLHVWLDLDDREDLSAASFLDAGPSGVSNWIARRASDAYLPHLERAASECDLVSFACADDVDGFDTSAHTAVVPNIVPNRPAFTPEDAVAGRLLFVGGYNWEPNRDAIDWFLSRCWNDLLSTHPHATLSIVGAGRQRTFAALRARFADVKGVSWNLNAPDLAPHYSEAHCVISPIQLGSGSKIKDLEAAAFGRPVVATPHSVRGLHADLAASISACATAKAFTQACRDYLDNADQSHAIGQHLRSIQVQHHGPETITASIRSLFADLTTKKRAEFFPQSNPNPIEVPS